MKTVNIFIASSIVEFHKERERFVMVMGRLHDYLYENDICKVKIFGLKEEITALVGSFGRLFLYV